MAFIFDAEAGETPETIARQREIAAMILGQGPVASPNTVGGGIGNALASLAGGFAANSLNKRADAAQSAGRGSADSLFQQLVGGIANGTPITGAAAPSQAPSGDMSAYQNAISGIESGGRYDAVGPSHPKLGRALGKYQVMEANVGPWSQVALGRAVSPEEFLANPQIQDAVFNSQFGQYVKQFGPQGAAQAWFAGPGGIGTNRQDSLGTSVPEYTAKFNAALGSGDQAQMPANAQPTQGASQQPPQMQGGPSMQQIMQVLSNPWSTPQQRATAELLLKQQMEAQDPRRKLELQKTQLEVEALRNPLGKPTDTQRNLEWRAREAGLTPGTPEYADFMRKGGSGPQTVVNVGEGDKFYENLDKKNAETFAALSDAGMTGRSRLAQLNQLEQVLTQAPTGAGAQVKLWLGDLGINTDGLDDLQATRALIEKMVPEQRAPGSGPMSDADIAMYRKSLPNVINQPGGNAIILGTAKAIAEYDMQMGQIADAVADREITPAEGRKRIRELKNPLDGYRERLRELNGGQSTSGNNLKSKYGLE